MGKDKTNDLYAVPWNGTDFVTSNESILSTSTVSDTIRHFFFSWEDSSGDGLAVYGVGTNAVYRNYTSSTGAWSAQATVLSLGADASSGVRLCPAPGSDFIGMIVQDAGADVNVRIWNGSEFLASPPTQDAASEASGANNDNIDCAWYNSNSALFGYIRNAALNISYFNFTRPSTWSVAALTSAPTSPVFAADDIAGLRFTEHPTTSELMVIEQDILEDVRAIRWNGTAFVIPPTSILEGVTEVTNGAQESAQFDWNRFDPVPSVTAILPANGTHFNQTANITISANVTDNIAVSAVLANITLPNGTVSQITLIIDGGTKYNNTFNDTSTNGTYTIRIIANDTSSHQNVNRTQTSIFIIDPSADTTFPAVFDVRPVASSTYNASATIEIAANVTDDRSVSLVRANITYPNGTIQLLTLNLNASSKYNNSFTIPPLLGLYNITFLANDTSNNLNNSIKTNFTAVDQIVPNVTAVLPTAGTSYNISDIVTISANVSDYIAVSTVRANVTYPNGTIELLTLILDGGTKYNVTFTAPVLIGRYNVTILANDSSNNVNNTETTYFNVNDTTNPNVTALLPTAGTSYNISDVVTISANVTDNVAVSTVRANLTYPNGTAQLLSLVLSSGTKYNVTFTAPVLIGRYNVTILANDSSNNLNNTETTYFNVNDTTNPNVTAVLPTAGTTYNISDVVTISANVTDNVAVSTVKANVTYPNGTMQLLSLILSSGTKYNVTFTAPVLIGRYNVTILTNDSSNNLNNTETTYFNVNDTTNPNVTALLPTAGTSYNISDVVTISANVTDNINVSSVRANLTYPNGTAQLLSLVLSSGTKYNVTFTAPVLIGRYNVTIIANDSSNNLNNSETTYFNVNDVTNPAVVNITPIAGSSYNVSNIFDVSANVSDDVAVSTVRANITYPNGSITLLTLTNSGGAKYNNTFTAPAAIGVYNITFIANDTSNNVNRSEKTNFTVNDVTNPAVVNITPTVGSQYNISNVVTISANVSDDVAVSTVLANVTYPNGSVTLLTLINSGGAKYNNTFTAPAAIGVYNITFIANDTSNNVNRSEKTNFTVNDITPPAVFDVRPVSNTSYNVSQTITISANVTDNIAVGVVLANITFPNSSVELLTLVLGNGSQYNNTFAIPNVIGTYNITFIANDSSNNANRTVTTFFVGNDVTNPAVVNITPISGSQYNISEIINISVNVTDNVAVSAVIANITYPNGSITQLALILSTGTIYNNTFTAPAAIGLYNITFIANDTSNNVNRSEKTNFTVNDVTNPAVVNITPIAGSQYNISNVVTISANVSDDVAVSTVRANISYPNGSITILTLINSVDGVYNNTFTAPAAIGMYNITFIANDSSNNVNRTEHTNFTVYDVTPPAVFDVRPVSNTSYNVSQTITISANVTDNIAVGVVLANITFPNSSVELLTLVLGNGSQYNNTFSIPNVIGTYNITFIANDTSNNANRTVTTFFVGNDVTNPAVVNLTPAAGSQYNISDVVTISANVSDDVAVSTVRANITYPNSSVTLLTLINSGGAKYNNTFTAPVLIGVYNITFIANDTSNNVNRSEKTNFTVNDVTNPAVVNITPTAGSQYNISNEIVISANVSDNIAVSTVLVNVTYPNGTIQQLTLINSVDAIYNRTFTAPAQLGTYNITFFANDTSNNINATERTNFTVFDATPPAVTIIDPPEGSSYSQNFSITINANVSDEIGVSFVFANVTYNGTTIQVNLTDTNADGIYNGTFVNTSTLGAYTLRIIANDTSNNINSTEMVTFDIQDVTAPIVMLVSPLNNGTFFNYNNITFICNATDNAALANITLYHNISGIFSANETHNISGVVNQSNFTINLIADGVYIWNCQASDTDSNIDFATNNRTLRIDTTSPSVTNVTPAAGSVYNVSTTIKINATVIDRFVVSSVYVNITYPNSTIQQLTLFLVPSTFIYSNNFTIPNIIGGYNLTFAATDSAGNINRSVGTNFTATDFINPNITAVLPTAGISYNISDVVTISANVTDNINVSSVRANVTYPNGTIQLLTLINSNGTRYNITFTAPALIGRYNVTIIANDSSNNLNNTETTYFNVNDVTNLNVTAVLPTAGTSYNISDVVTISANVTDDVAVSTVRANITYPNGTIQLLTLILDGGSKYNITFTTSPVLIGQYNVTIIANDSSNNLNNTETTYFNVNDVTDPNVTAVLPTAGTSYNISDVVTLSANVTDNINMSLVRANVTYPNGTIQLLTLLNSNGTRYNVTFTTPVLIGRYNVTILANDSSNNLNNSETTYFNVNDVTNPNVTAVLPTAGTSYNISDVVTISANVTDNINVSSVRANVTYPNGTIQLLTLLNSNGTRYNITFTAPALIGRYNVTIIANDSSNNLNNSETTYFNVNDTTNPNVTSVLPAAGTSYNISDVVTISANVTDDVAVYTVRANITYPNGTIELLTLILDGGSKYNITFTTSPVLIGRYNITIIANDSSNNLNNTETTYFNVNDVSNPNVTAVLPTAGTIYNVSNVITISANVTDNVGVSVVLANITYPNGTLQLLTLVNSSGTRYNNTFTAPALIGVYNITFIANDTSNNVNRSEKTNFTVRDVTNPTVVNITPIAGSQYNTSNIIDISANVTDDIAVSSVLANITYPNGSITQLTLANSEGNKYNNTFTAPNLLGLYNVTFFANDTSDNRNSTERTNFTVNDASDPIITITGCNPSQANQSQAVICNATITDNIAISNVSANVTLPNGTVQIQTIQNTSSNYWFNFTDTQTFGLYNLTWSVNDSSNNRANASGNFSVGDVTSPTLSNFTFNPALPLFNNGSAQNITINFSSSEFPINVTFNLYYINNTFAASQGPITLTDESSLPLNYTVLGNLSDADYTLNITAVDESNNRNIYTLGNITVDSITPFAANITGTPASPIYNNGSSQNIIVNFSSSEYPVDIIFYLYNRTSGISNYSSTVRLNSSSNLPLNYTLSGSLAEGNYTFNFTLADRAGNTNQSNISLIFIDTTAPSITNMTCHPANINLTQTLQCNATISDNLQLNTIWIGMTLPNGSSFTPTFANIGSNYHFNFSGNGSDSNLVGQYNFTWNANDSSRNYANATFNFNISDVTAPAITLNSPATGANISNISVLLNFTVSDNYYSFLNCSLYINGTLNQTNALVANGTPTLFTVSALTNGSRNWNITCFDNSSNSNFSETRIFTIDTSVPTFISLTTYPNSEADLDPGLNVTIFANITENVTAIDLVILQRKLDNDTLFTNQTLTLNASSGLYYGAFNATQNGTYNLRLAANDTAGNSATSNFVNITVEYDHNWTRTPSAFVPVSTTFGTNVTLGNISINNTGDFEINFTLGSNSNRTIFNGSANFTLAAKGLHTLVVNDTATSTGIKTVAITINASAGAVPSSQTTTGQIIVAPGQPVIVATFTVPTTETLSVTQGNTNVAFQAHFENIGEGNASNATLVINLPNDWTITFGTPSETLSEFDSGDTTDIDIEVTIPTNASTGLKTVLANITAVNSSGTDLNDAGLIFPDNVSVTVNALPAVLGAAAEAVTPEAVSGSLPSSGTGGSAGGGGGLPISQAKELIIVKRGTSHTVPLKVQNIYSNTYLDNVKLELGGFMNQYIDWIPKVLNDIKYNQSKNFILNISVPAYVAVGDYNLTAKIMVDIIPLNPRVSGYEKKTVSEYRTIILRVTESSIIDLSREIDVADKCIAEMKTAKIPTSKVENLLLVAGSNIREEKYDAARKVLVQICNIKDDAFEAQKLIQEVEKNIAEASTKGLLTPETTDALDLTKLAFAREDFALAIDRAKTTQLTYVLEVKGRINIVQFVKDHWKVLLLAGFLSVVGLTYVSILARKALINQGIKNLNKEEEVIHDLMAEAQEDSFQKKKISESQYHRYIQQYEQRLAKIKQIRTSLRHTRASLLPKEQSLQKIALEKEEIKNMLKENQQNYFQKHTTTSNKFKLNHKSGQERLQEIYQEEENLKSGITHRNILIKWYDKTFGKR